MCDVIAGDPTGSSGGDDAMSSDPASGHSPLDSHGAIYVRFSHPEPPWTVLVGRLDGMATELQVCGSVREKCLLS